MAIAFRYQSTRPSQILSEKGTVKCVMSSDENFLFDFNATYCRYLFFKQAILSSRLFKVLR